MMKWNSWRPPQQLARLTALVALSGWMWACGSEPKPSSSPTAEPAKSPTKAGGAEGPAERLSALTKRLCACADLACSLEIHEKVRTFEKKHAGYKGSAAEIQKLEETKKTLSGCSKALSKKLAPRRGLNITGGGPGVTLAVVAPDGTRSVRTLPYVADRLQPGRYRLQARTVKDVSAHVRGQLVYWDRYVLVRDAVERVTVPAPKAPARDYILAFGERYYVGPGLRAITFQDKLGFSFYATKRSSVHPRKAQNGTLIKTRKQEQRAGNIRAIVLHSDLVADARANFRVLSQRSLSTHFSINWDGTIYQGVDLKDAAIHAGKLNNMSVSVDLNGLAKNLRKKEYQPPEKFMYQDGARMWNGRTYGSLSAEEKRKYRRRIFPTDKPYLKFENGARIRSYGYTDAQYASLIRLSAVLVKLFPRIKPVAPFRPDKTIDLGVIPWSTVEHGGIFAHWHLSAQRWDPGPGFEWARFQSGLSRALRGDVNVWVRARLTELAHALCACKERACGMRMASKARTFEKDLATYRVFLPTLKSHSDITRRIRRCSDSLAKRFALPKGLSVTGGGKDVRLEVVTPDGARTVHALPYTSTTTGRYQLRARVGERVYWDRFVVTQAGHPLFGGGQVRVFVPGPNTSARDYIVAFGERYYVGPGIRAITFEDKLGRSFYGAGTKGLLPKGMKAYYSRKDKLGKIESGKGNLTTLQRGQNKLSSIVLHADNTPDSLACFRVLAARGLSEHFNVNWDGTIYQFLDVKDLAIHAGNFNSTSIAITLNNLMKNLRNKKYQPAAKHMYRDTSRMWDGREYGSLSPEERRRYQRRIFPADKPFMRLDNGARVRAYGYTDAQYASLIQLSAVLVRLFPKIKPQAPFLPKKGIDRGLVPEATVRGGGIFAHWHLSEQRWDPGPGLEWRRLDTGLRKALQR